MRCFMLPPVVWRVELEAAPWPAEVKRNTPKAAAAAPEAGGLPV
jgi:hypothetical protein